MDGRGVLFKYNAEYLETGFNISPLKLRFDRNIQKATTNLFLGLFGVFADSLPDAWGRLLLKKRLEEEGVALETLNALDQLSFVGENGLGALIYRPIEEKKHYSNSVNLDILNGKISAILNGKYEEIIDEIFKTGGSPGGARPKIYASYNAETESLIHGVSTAEKGYEHWMIKFASTTDPLDVANIEMAYYYMALEAGVILSECKLFHGKSGKHYFGTKRFDRIGNHRVHMISSAGMFDDDYEHSQLDYGALLYEANELTKDAQTLEQIFRLACFNVLAHNRDDHSKNFAFLMDKKGRWKFAPAYDLTFSASSQGLHSTSCAGNYTNPNEKELRELANDFSIKNGDEIIKGVNQAILNWKKHASRAFVSKKSKEMIDRIINAPSKKPKRA